MQLIGYFINKLFKIVATANFKLQTGETSGSFSVLLSNAWYKEELMAEGYCVKCKAKKEIKDSKEVTMKNGRKALKGSCPECGTGMYRILGSK